MIKRHEDYTNMVQRLYAGHDISANHSVCRNITFQVTNACNLRCSYCYEHHKGTERMSIETGRKIVDYAILKNVEEIKQLVANTSASEQAAAQSASAANASAIAASKSERISTENASSAAASERASRDSAADARASEGNALNYMNRTADIANQVAGSAASINFAFGPDADGRFAFFARRSS